MPLCPSVSPSFPPSSVRIEPIPIVEAQGWILVLLLQEAIADHEDLDLAAHETAECVIGRAGDRLAAHIEAGIDENWAAGQCLKTAQQRMVARVGLTMHGLNPRRIIDVGDGWDLRTRHVQLVDAEEIALGFADCAATA